MHDSTALTAEGDVRVRRLERRVTIITVAFLAYVGISIFVMVHDLRAQRRAFWTTSLFAGQLQLPPPQAWSSQAVSAGLAPATDGKSIAFWLSSGVLQQLGDPRSKRQQVNLSLDALGNEDLTFFDRNGHKRLRLAVAEDGTPSITLLGANGKVTWSTEPPLQ